MFDVNIDLSPSLVVILLVLLNVSLSSHLILCRPLCPCLVRYDCIVGVEVRSVATTHTDDDKEERR